MIVVEQVHATSPPHLPYHVSLLPGEALSSWISRLAARFEISALHLLQGAFGLHYIDRYGMWWRLPKPNLLAEISARTSVSVMRLRAATVSDWSPGSPGGEAGWGQVGRKFLGGAIAKVSEVIAVCPRCLLEDGCAYVRMTWLFQWLSCCPKHGVTLVCTCRSCHARLSMLPLASVRPWSSDHCWRCGSSIITAETMEAHNRVRVFQRRLLAGKRSGWIMLSGLEPMAWPPFVEGLNAIAEVVWVHGKPACREELFAIIAKNVGVEALEPYATPRASGHGGRARHDAMLVISWLLERWPDRMMILTDVFGAAKRRWGIKCSHPEPIRRALQALPWPLARDLLWRMEGWDPSQDTRAIRMPSSPTARRSLRATRSPRDQGLFNGSIERPL